MKAWVIATTLTLSIWVIIHQQPTWAAVDFTLNLKTPTKDGYTNFLNAIRLSAKDPTLTYGGTGRYAIPVMAAPAATPQYYRVDLVGTVGTIGVALKKSDLYLVAYLSKNPDGKFQVHYFDKQISITDINKVFPEAKDITVPIKIIFAENYGAITAKAGGDRITIGLGIGKLDGFIGDNYMKAFNVQNEAKLLLVAIQMVSEASRFKYIETQVRNTNFPGGFSPTSNVLILEDNWENISKAIKSFSKEGVFTRLFKFEDSNHKYSWEVTEVSDLGAALLKRVEDNGFDNLMGSSETLESFDEDL